MLGLNEPTPPQLGLRIVKSVGEREQTAAIRTPAPVRHQQLHSLFFTVTSGECERLTQPLLLTSGRQKEHNERLL